jgi:RND superfamily putative drug exporter
LAFDSLVLPFKAIIMNFLSLSVMFGVLVWVFQDGHLSGLLGFTAPAASSRERRSCSVWSL